MMKYDEDDVKGKYKKLLKFKIIEARDELEKYKNKLTELELSQLKDNCNETETGDKQELENLEKCVKNAKNIKKYRPGTGKMLERKQDFTERVIDTRNKIKFYKNY